LANPTGETTSWGYRDNGWLQSKTLSNASGAVVTSTAYAQVRPLLRQYDVSFSMSASPTANARLARRYGVQLYPTLLLLDGRGRVVWSHSGALDVPVQTALTGRVVALLSDPPTR